jgi:hypothetical protein
MMRKLALGIAASTAMLAFAPLATAQTASDGRMIFGVETVGLPSPLQDVQFAFGGRNFCWYPGGWNGPGFYWCGYAYRRGFGWGGPAGWHGWHGGGGHGGGDHGGFAHGGAGFHGGDAHGAPGGGAHMAMAAHAAPGGGEHGGGDHGGGGHGGGGHGGGGEHH